MPDDAREQLAQQQAQLISALAGQIEPPAGFDAPRVELVGRTLVSKRRKGVARAWPRLTAALGDRYPEQFDSFAISNAPAPEGPAADGYAFAQWLDRRRALPAKAVPEFLLARLWRGPRISCVTRRVARRLWVGMRLPIVGVRLVAFPWIG